MSRLTGPILWILMGLALGPGCQEVIIACAADGTCPAGRICIEGLCKSATGSPDVAQVSDAPPADNAAPTCKAATAAGPTARSPAGGGVVGGKLLVVGGDATPGTPCKHVPQATGGAWQLGWCEGWSSTSGGAPSARADAASASNVVGDAVALFGGRQRSSGGGPWLIYSDLWRYGAKESAWKLLANGGPPGRSRSALAMASNGDLFLQGGDAGNVDALPLALADTWRLSYADNKWKRLLLSGGPGARYGHAMAITRDDRYLVVVGGADGPLSKLLEDAWRLDLETETWQQIAGAGGGPTARMGAGLLAIPGDARLLFFGGRDLDIGARNDLWVLEPASGGWELAIAGDLGAGGLGRRPAQPADNACVPPVDYLTIEHESPPRRSDFVWGYEPSKMQLWLFGGRGPCGPLRDAWSLHLPSVTWHLHEPSEDGWSCPRRGGTCTSLCGGT